MHFNLQYEAAISATQAYYTEYEHIILNTQRILNLVKPYLLKNSAADGRQLQTLLQSHQNPVLNQLSKTTADLAWTKQIVDDRADEAGLVHEASCLYDLDAKAQKALNTVQAIFTQLSINMSFSALKEQLSLPSIQDVCGARMVDSYVVSGSYYNFLAHKANELFQQVRMQGARHFMQDPEEGLKSLEEWNSSYATVFPILQKNVEDLIKSDKTQCIVELAAKLEKFAAEFQIIQEGRVIEDLATLLTTYEEFLPWQEICDVASIASQKINLQHGAGEL